ncbi:MAG: hypothetical protein QOI81_26 [Actinomycetota bacterium]|nr:hypothetical protein [Actinomycetota bacterium]
MKHYARLLSIGSTAILAATLWVGTSPSALAVTGPPRTLPSGNRMYTIPCNTAPDQYHLFRVHPTTGAFTSIGGTTDIQGSTCAYGMAYDATTKKSYFIAGNTTSDNWPLMKVNLRTGAEYFIRNIKVAGTALHQSTAFPAVAAISNKGHAYLIAANNLYSLNLRTARAVLIGATGAASDIYAFAINPKTNVFYAVGDAGEVYSINIHNGIGTYLGTVSTVNNAVYSLQIDTAGIFWINEGGSDSTSPPRIGSFRLQNIAGSMIASSGQMTYYSGAFLIKH